MLLRQSIERLNFAPLVKPLALAGCGSVAARFGQFTLLGNGFIVTALLWGGGAAALLDRQLVRAARFMLVAAGATLCGVIHSPLPSGALFLPWSAPDPIVGQVAAGYLAMAGVFALLAGRADRGRAGDDRHLLG